MSKEDKIESVVPKGGPVLHAVEGATGGALAGAAAGALAGPPGAIIGAVLGAAAGATAEVLLEREDEAARAEDERVDEAIGVAGGDMGAPNLRHPPPRTGAYSAAAAGAGGTTTSPAEGPMPSGEEGAD